MVASVLLTAPGVLAETVATPGPAPSIVLTSPAPEATPAPMASPEGTSAAIPGGASTATPTPTPTPQAPDTASPSPAPQPTWPLILVQDAATGAAIDGAVADYVVCHKEPGPTARGCTTASDTLDATQRTLTAAGDLLARTATLRPPRP